MDSSQRPSPPLEKLTCKNCGSVLGEHDGTSFRAGGVVLVRSADLHCAACGGRRRWVPAKKSAPST